MSKRVHFIAIGGSAMHNLALALHEKGYQVTGSDDEIFEPSKTRLANKGLLPNSIGWNVDIITKDIDAIILGMHARKDNPELLKAQELGLKIYSYPEFVYQSSLNKQRVVIAGSHGKTTITSMIMHVLNQTKKDFDYLVGAQIEGFDTMVRLSDAPIIIIEGDEYLTSPLDSTPKFLHYHHHIGVISGIAWDHINVYPTFEDYVKQFDKFIDATPKAGVLIYDDSDDLVTFLCKKERNDITRFDYAAHKHEVVDGVTYLITDNGKVPIQVFGKHNLKNISAAYEVCKKLSITTDDFYKAIASFKGASNRLTLLGKNNNTHVFKDFAHAPSKVVATTKAVKRQFPEKKIVAVLELHTFSSLNKAFLNQYKDTLKDADIAMVYFAPETIAHKKLEPITNQDILENFDRQDLQVYTNQDELFNAITNISYNDKNLLLMSSGNFGGIDLKQLTQKIIN